MALRLSSRNIGVLVRKAIIFIVVFAITFSPFALFLIPFTSSAYVSSSDLFKNVFFSDASVNFSPSFDGCFVFQTTYKSFYSPDTVNSPSKLNTSSFVSGTWNGQDVSELSSKYLYDLDVAGFSQSVSYTDEKDYFVYSMVTCLPVKAGDRFTVNFSSNTSTVRTVSSNTFISTIYGCSGVRIVHNEEGTVHPGNPLTYTVSSTNQHFAIVLNPDLFNYHTAGYTFSSSSVCSDFSGLTSVLTHAGCTDIFTTSYEYTGDVSVTLKDSVDNYAFSVYEIFTDGTTTPGFNTEGEQSTVPPETTPGGSGVNIDLSEVLKRLIEIRQSIDDKIIEVTVNVSDAVQEKLDAILDTLVNLPANIWEYFRIGLDIPVTEPPETTPPETTGSSGSTETTTTESISLEIDQENFDKAMEEVDIEKLGSNIAGSKGAIAFFWFITDKFLDNTGLYIAVYISLFLAFCAWLLRS